MLVELIRYFAGGEGYTEVDGWLYASGIGALSLISAFARYFYTSITDLCGMKIRIASSSLIYRKVLRLSTGAVSKIPIGQLVNMLSNDVNRFDLFTFFNYLWISPIQAVIVLGILGSELGPSCLSGFLVLVFMIPMQSVIGKGFSKVRLALAKCTDKRVRVMHEVISYMRAIKMFTWEEVFIVILENARKYELDMLRKKSLLLSINSAAFITLTKFIVYFCLLTYATLGFPLTADKVYLTRALIASVQISFSVYFSLGIIQTAEAFMSCERLQNILEMKEKDDIGYIQHLEPRPRPKDCGLTLCEVTAKWSCASLNAVNVVSFSIKAGDLMAVIGPVGSGKTSLLNVMLGELPAHAGKVFVQGKITYASQEPWVFSGTVRENIIFCQQFSAKKYQDVVRVCALEQDLKELPSGDLTLVGEHGTALSGGQKARVNLARAIYSEADIYVLDDPLSAVDAHVGRHIYESCVMKYLRHKVRILVTHQVQYLKEASKILVLKEGRTQAYGTYAQLVNSGIKIGSLVHEQKNASMPLSEEGTTVKSDQSKNYIENQDNSIPRAVQDQKSSVPLTNSVTSEDSQQTAGSKDGEYEEVLKSSGSVKTNLQVKYFQAGVGWPILILFPLANIITEFFNSGTDFWLAYWTNNEEFLLTKCMMNKTMSCSAEETNSSFSDVPPGDLLDTPTYIYVYSGLIVALFVCSFLRSLSFYSACVASSMGLHHTMLGAVIRAPMRYFEFRPAGQILNRFSKDLGMIDEELPTQLLQAWNLLLSVLGFLVLISVTNVWLVVPAGVFVVTIVLIRQVSLPALCDLKRLEAVNRSPIFSHLSTSLHGLVTLRAFESRHIFVDKFDQLQNRHTSIWFTFLSLKRTFMFSLDLIGGVYVLLVTLSFMNLKDTPGGYLGLAISSAMTLSGMISWGLYQTAEAENQLTSVERVLEYCSLEPEAPWQVEDKTPKSEWPEYGVITYENVSLQYSEYEAPVLKNLTFYIKGSEKVGIVGRTGAGKSSLLSTLFRITEPLGDIRIDSLSVKELGLHDLRGRLSIIPQEPVLFSSTVRMNLDPFNEASDEKLWDVLEEIQMKSVVRLMSGGLDADLEEGGTNLSLGQRQLLCLARAILQHNKILVLDEASANIDLRTDELIQKVIRTKFHNCTVLTIAHRLQTIMDCDRVMVLQAGHLKEFDEPHVLLQDRNSLFSSMVQQTGHNTSRHLKQMAEYAYLQKRNSLGRM